MMPNPPNPNTVAALERVMLEMQNLIAHPRIQQRTWVARGREWVRILHIVHGELTGHSEAIVADNGGSLAEVDGASLLVEINAGGGRTYINVELANVQQVEVYRGGEPGHRIVRGAYSGFVMRDRRKYITNANEAQRLVDALRKRDDANP